MVVARADTIVYEFAVVVECVYTSIASHAVLGTAACDWGFTKIAVSVRVVFEVVFKALYVLRLAFSIFKCFYYWVGRI